MKISDHIKPPQWPLRILRFFLKDEYQEEIEGDLEELFLENFERFSPRKAKRIYIWEVLKLFRPGLVKNLEPVQHRNQYGMFKNYFKVSTRGMMKNPLNTFINLVGLAMAIGICLFVYGFANYTYSMDQFHKNKNEVYLTTFLAKRDGTLSEFGTTPRPLGELMQKDFPQIKSVCRLEDRNVVIKYDEKVFHENLRFADPSFLEMFTFPLKWGNTNSLADLNSIILSEDMSVKYFGNENPLGRHVLLKFGKDHRKSFVVAGVAKEFPSARTIDFDFLVNFENLKTSDPDYDFHDWNAFVNATLIQVDHASDLQMIKMGMFKYKKLQNETAAPDWAISSFAFEQLSTLPRKAGSIRNSISSGSDDNYKSVVFLLVIGAFMLALACFNYINIAIVSAAKRLKEIGIRKSFGATRKMLIVQFMSENIITTFFALVLGIFFGIFVAIPWFEDLNHFSMGFTLKDARLWIYLPAILLLTGILSGLYPSLYISKFEVVGILKGSVKFGMKNPLTKVFLVFQLILSCMLITSAVMFTENTNYLSGRSWGYQQKSVLYTSLPDASSFEKLSALMKQDPNVLSISGSEEHLGKKSKTTVIHFPDRQLEVDQFLVGGTYFETLGLEVINGRSFRENYESDKKTIVVNELLAKSLTVKNPVGQMVEIDSIRYQIIGIVKDFHSRSFHRKIKPAIFLVADKDNYQYMSMKVRAGTENKSYKALQSQWANLFPEIPFDGGFQEDIWGNYYEQIGVHAKVWKAIALIAVILTCLGLYGLVKLNITGRVREFSIRKVLGAGIGNITQSITRQYIILLSIALVIATPLSWFVVKSVIELAYSYHMPITFSGIAIAVGILILVVLLTISSQILKVLKINPVKGLKIE